LGAFGDKLRKQREQRGIELDAISNTTKISTRMLRALEEEHFDQLPGGVFNKGFVRAYARHVGLDEQEAIADYLAALNGSQVPPQENLPTPARNRAESSVATAKIPAQIRPAYRPNDGRPAAVPPPEPRAPKVSAPPEPLATPVERFPKKYPAAALAEDADQHSTPIPWEKLAVALLLVALVLAFWSYRRHRQQIAAAHPTVAVPQSPVPSSVANRDHTVSAENPAAKNSAGTNAATAQSTTPTSPTTDTSVSSSASSASLGSPALNSADDADSADTPASTSASQNAAHAVASKPLPTFTLVIRATETSWISITADGNPVATETLIAPAGTSVRATKEIVVKTGNAAGLTFSLKGKTIPTQGNEGEVKTFTFDPTGLREPVPAQTPTTNP
jgi:cytoskeletal protein RodZ